MVYFLKWLAKTHPKYKTSYHAILTVKIIALLISVVLPIPFGPFNAAIITGDMAGIGLVLIHSMSNIAYINFARKTKDEKYSIFLDIIVPIISTISLLPLLILAFDMTPWPYLLAPLMTVLWII